MPYIGRKYRSNDRLITVKIYGPDYEFKTTPKNIEEATQEVISTSNAEKSALADWVAIRLAEEFHNDNTIRWVECEVLYADGSFYGGVSELIG